MTGDDKKIAEEVTDDELEDVEGGALRRMQSISKRSRSKSQGETDALTITYTIADGSEAINTATINTVGGGIKSKKR